MGCSSNAGLCACVICCLFLVLFCSALLCFVFFCFVFVFVFVFALFFFVSFCFFLFYFLVDHIGQCIIILSKTCHPTRLPARLTPTTLCGYGRVHVCMDVKRNFMVKSCDGEWQREVVREWEFQRKSHRRGGADGVVVVEREDFLHFFLSSLDFRIIA